MSAERDEKLAKAVEAALDEFSRSHDFGDTTGEFIHAIIESLRPRLIAAMKEGGE